MSTEKIKKQKPLPARIHYSVIIFYAVTLLIVILATSVFFSFVDTISDTMRTNSLLAINAFTPIVSFVFGWWWKWSWTKKNGTDEQFKRVRAQFWATSGFFTAFVLTLLTILIGGIVLEQDALLPQTAPDSITFIIGISILVIGLGIAWNTRNRILRNFNQQ
ncbi:MAG: hypothetical protein AAF846_21890 [Chloroflexota bacterium]